jgi:SAM-dependent methyltransferase
MNSTEHYERLLGRIYTWMAGGFEPAVAAAAEELQAAGVAVGPGCSVIDLGCGSGFHAVAAGRRGATVWAVDSCTSLLDELRRQSQGLNVTPIHRDLSSWREAVADAADVVLCMGDTLTHLPTFEAVDRLLDDVAAHLRPGGTFVATFRDYTGEPPTGAARFIPVRADDERISTCFLEYHAESVTVTDLLYEREGGLWRFHASGYRKLRLSPTSVVGRLRELGFDVREEPSSRGMKRIVGRRN